MQPNPIKRIAGQFLLTVLLCAAAAPLLIAGDWPAWRGPSGDGVSDETGLPVTWSATENVTWKTPLPGPGNSTPVISGERIFLTGATEKGAVRSVMCFDRKDGKLLWQRDTAFAGEEPTHETNPYCSASPTTDGKHVYAWHGSAGVVAYDVEGEPLWHRDLGPFNHIWGNAGSPVLHDGKVILLVGPGPETRLLALDPATGETVWKNDLAEAKGDKPDHWKGSWGTPVVRKLDDGKSELLIGLPGYLAAFSPASGEELWRCRGLTDLVYANPLVGVDAEGNGVAVAMSGYGGSAIGCRLPKTGEAGDLTDTHRLWLHEKNHQRVGSGLIANGHVYIVNEPGIAQCIELSSGRKVWEERVCGSSWGSLVLAEDKLYVTDQEGTTIVLRPSPQFEMLHDDNKLGELTRASVAVSDGQIFIRTYNHLYCIGPRRTVAAAK